MHCCLDILVDSNPTFQISFQDMSHQNCQFWMVFNRTTSLFLRLSIDASARTFGSPRALDTSGLLQLLLPASIMALGTSWLLHMYVLRPLPGLWVRVGFYTCTSLGLSQGFEYELASMPMAPLASPRTLDMSRFLCLQLPWLLPGLWARVGFYAYSSLGLSQGFGHELALSLHPLISGLASKLSLICHTLF